MTRTSAESTWRCPSTMAAGLSGPPEQQRRVRQRPAGRRGAHRGRRFAAAWRHGRTSRDAPRRRAAAAPTRRSSTQHAEPAGAGETKLIANYAERYFGAPPGDGQMGQRTIMIRKAFQKVQKKQKRKYGWIIAALAVGGAGGRRVTPTTVIDRCCSSRRSAEELFYAHEVARRGYREPRAADGHGGQRARARIR